MVADYMDFRRETSGIPDRFFGIRWRDFSHPEAVYAAAAKVYNATKSPGLYAIIGPRRLGKTAMACAAIHDFIGRSDFFSRYKTEEVIADYFTAMQFFRRLKSSFGPGAKEKEDEIFNEILRLDLLVIDEINVGMNSKFTDANLDSLIRERADQPKWTFLLSNLEEKVFKNNVGDSIASRITSILPCDWEPFDELNAKSWMPTKPRRVVDPEDPFPWDAELLPPVIERSRKAW